MQKEIVYKGFCQLELRSTEQQRDRVVLQTSDSLCVLVYDKTRDAVLLVQQSRLAMIRHDNPDGTIIELIAGRFDAAYTPQELAAKEAAEEAGVTILPEQVVLLNGGNPMAVSAGVLTERSYLAYVEVTSENVQQKEQVFGSSDEQEHITRVWLPVHEIGAYLTRCECVRVYALLQYFLLRQHGLV